MPLVLFSWLSTNPYFRDLNNINIREAMYQDKIKNIEENITPFGFIIDGSEEEIYADGQDVWTTNKSDDKPMLPPGYYPSNL
jgi:hypothetical protein